MRTVCVTVLYCAWTKSAAMVVTLAGGYDSEEKAARAYDIAAVLCKGPSAVTNFPREDYARLLPAYRGLSCEALVAEIRRQSS